MKLTKTSLYLFVIFILALILRFYAADHIDLATDEMIYSILPLNIISAGQLGTVEQSTLFFYLTDLGYKLFGGITAISARFFSALFGALAVFLVFLITKELFKDNKSALLSAFLFALSGFALRFNYEMDMVAYFFIFLSLFFYLKFLNTDNLNYLYPTFLFFSLAVLVKTLTLLFVLSYILIFLFYQHKLLFNRSEQRINFNQKTIKTLFLVIVLVLLLFLPVFSYNYLSLTNSKEGITDFYFSTMLGIGKSVHQGMEGKAWSTSTLYSNFKQKIILLFQYDLLILFAGLFGLIYLFNQHRQGVLLFILSLIIPFAYLAGKTGSGSHYLWLPMILSIFSGPAILKLKEKFNSKESFSPKLKKQLVSVVGILLLLLILIPLFFTLKEITGLRSQSITLALREYVHENIPENAIVVIDPRIYRGIHAWVFNDKHYIEGTYFSELSNALGQIPGQVSNIPLYYIECNPKTNCGWKPEDFQRIFETGEQISNYFKEKLKKVAEINVEHSFNIYAGEMKAPSGVYEVIDKTHQFWFYPVGWKYPEQAVDYYQAQGFDRVIEGFAFFILWIEVIIALLSIPLVFWLGLKKEE